MISARKESEESQRIEKGREVEKLTLDDVAGEGLESTPYHDNQPTMQGSEHEGSRQSAEVLRQQ